jgi:hypothetical protein
VVRVAWKPASPEPQRLAGGPAALGLSVARLARASLAYRSGTAAGQRWRGSVTLYRAQPSMHGRAPHERSAPVPRILSAGPPWFIGNGMNASDANRWLRNHRGPLFGALDSPRLSPALQKMGFLKSDTRNGRNAIVPALYS